MEYFVRLHWPDLAGCNSLNSLMEPGRVDYKSAGKAPTLEIPPDLTQLQRENRYAIPEANRGTATASGFNLQQGSKASSIPWWRPRRRPTCVSSAMAPNAGWW